MSEEEAGPARFVDSTGFKVEPITTNGMDWWYGYDEEGMFTGTPPDYDVKHHRLKSVACS